MDQFIAVENKFRIRFNPARNEFRPTLGLDCLDCDKWPGRIRFDSRSEKNSVGKTIRG